MSGLTIGTDTAFPNTVEKIVRAAGDTASPEPGLTKREWFAGMVACGSDAADFPSAFEQARFIVATADEIIMRLNKDEKKQA